MGTISDMISKLPPQGKIIIYTIGISNREIKEFIEILNTYEIKIVVDVRRFPTSTFEWFKQDNLARILAKHMIGYSFLGKELGGFRKSGYETYTKSDNLQRGLVKIEHFAFTERIGSICSERFPWKCHRRHIGSCLEDRGWDLIHIIEKDKIWKPKKSKGSVK